MDPTMEYIAEDIKRRCVPWRAMIIGVDGRDGEGKSTFARYRAWRLEMPCIDLDMFLNTGKGEYDLRFDDLSRAICTGLNLNRPVLVEGIFLLQMLRELNFPTEILVYAKKRPPNLTSTFEAKLRDYRHPFKPEAVAQHVYVWDDPDAR